MRDIHVMSGWAKILQLLSSENIDRDEMYFSMPVLSSLGSAHFHDLARAAFDHDKTVLSQRRALHGISA